MAKQQYLYVIFSSTPYKIGKFIQTVTGYPYNHVAVSLDAKPQTLYAFARHYKNTPFYGGFVLESGKRYQYKGHWAQSKVCAIPITPRQYHQIRSYLEQMNRHANQYLYNMFSAVCYPLHKKIHLRQAFTCVEFAVELLDKFQIPVGVTADRFYSIKDLADCLQPYLVYTGPVTGYLSDATWARDTFPLRQNLWSKAYLTVSANQKLLHLLLRRAHS